VKGLAGCRVGPSVPTCKMRRSMRLTTTCRFIYRYRFVAMPRSLHLRLHPSASAWRVGVCLVLAALFLYNPFFTIYGASQSLNVQHPLSYRATLASSELRRCTVEPSKTLIPALEGALAFGLTQLAAAKEVVPAVPRDLSRFVPQVLCNDLWFRPPPVL
jgi:hypothetical protein